MVTKIPTSVNNALRRLDWRTRTPYIIAYLKGETKQTPRPVRLFGEDHFKLVDGRLFVYGREVITDVKRKHQILNTAEESYGGQRKAADRINRSYFGISRSDVMLFFSGSERRQLKARHQKSKRQNAFIHARSPGVLQIDLTFYRGAKIPVFGAVDVFSRYAYYERVPGKRADLVVKAMQNCLKHFNGILAKDRKIVKVSSDAGVEFQAEFKQFLKKNHIFYDKQVKSRKMIESLNRTLRRYIERVGWDTLKELDDLIARFLDSYNQSKHKSTNKVPVDLIALPPEEEKKEGSRQHMIGKKRVQSARGFNVAKLKAGDTVRIYDPKRREIKAKQKAELKGKIKLSENDYVKKFTSHHMGNEPHWTQATFTIERVLTGKRGTQRFLVKGKKGAFLRSELQKVKPVMKRDPRRRVIEKRKAEQKKLDARKPQPLRAVIVGKEVHIPQKAVALAVHKDFLIAVSLDSLHICTKKDIKKESNKKTPIENKLKIYDEEIKHLSKQIDDYLLGNLAKLPTKIPIPKDALTAGRKVIVLWDKKVYEPYAMILLPYKAYYIVHFSDDGSVAAVPRSDVHKILEMEDPQYLEDTLKIPNVKKAIQDQKEWVDTPE